MSLSVVVSCLSRLTALTFALFFNIFTLIVVSLPSLLLLTTYRIVIGLLFAETLVNI